MNTRPPSPELTSRQPWRTKAVVLALALISWGIPISLLLLIDSNVRPGAMIGLAVCAGLLILSLVLAWTLDCPWCGEQLFFVASLVTSPSWTQIQRQFVPYDILAHSRFTCPHCHSRFMLRRE
jgi:hypothetical protein